MGRSSIKMGDRILVSQEEIVAYTPWNTVDSVRTAHHRGFPVEYIEGHPYYDPQRVAAYFQSRSLDENQMKERKEKYQKALLKRKETIKKKQVS